MKIPMMPKGVEHTDLPQLAGQIAMVKIPMMPKGVEHHEADGMRRRLLDREDSYDAERR